MSEHDRALSLQRDVLKLTRKLADEISRSPLSRDNDAIDDLTHKIEVYRPRLSAAYRALRRLDRAPKDKISRRAYDAQRKIARDTKLLGQRLKKWDWIENLIQRHKDPQANPLDLSQPETEYDAVLNKLHMAFYRLANPYSQSKDSRDHGCFADIPLNIKPFEQLMRVAYRLLLIQGKAHSSKFLDVGCGGGTKVLVASEYFTECHGLDFEADYVAAGQQMLQLTDSDTCRIFQADGLTFDQYDNYDVIYFYRPLRDDALLAQMEDQIFSNAKPGTVILAPYTGSLERRPEIDYPSVKDCVFVAGMTQAEIDVLHKEAELTDTDKILGPKGMRFDPGFWEPLLEVATFNGRN